MKLFITTTPGPNPPPTNKKRQLRRRRKRYSIRGRNSPAAALPICTIRCYCPRRW
ncbi:MAG: hypothetical protein LH606_12035 [Cytophagaceae bacterium]|nr:hypothetical protein [Cytophagaceae bacterium]